MKTKTQLQEQEHENITHAPLKHPHRGILNFGEHGLSRGSSVSLVLSTTQSDIPPEPRIYFSDPDNLATAQVTTWQRAPSPYTWATNITVHDTNTAAWPVGKDETGWMSVRIDGEEVAGATVHYLGRQRTFILDQTSFNLSTT